GIGISDGNCSGISSIGSIENSLSSPSSSTPLILIEPDSWSTPIFNSWPSLPSPLMVTFPSSSSSSPNVVSSPSFDFTVTPSLESFNEFPSPIGMLIQPASTVAATASINKVKIFLLNIFSSSNFLLHYYELTFYYYSLFFFSFSSFIFLTYFFLYFIYF